MGHLVCLWLPSNTIKATMNILVYIPLNTAKCFCSEMSGSGGSSLFHFDRYCQIATLEGCDNLHSREWWFLMDWFPRETQPPPRSRYEVEPPDLWSMCSTQGSFSGVQSNPQVLPSAKLTFKPWKMGGLNPVSIRSKSEHFSPFAILNYLSAQPQTE